MHSRMPTSSSRHKERRARWVSWGPVWVKKRGHPQPAGVVSLGTLCHISQSLKQRSALHLGVCRKAFFTNDLRSLPTQPSASRTWSEAATTPWPERLHPRGTCMVHVTLEFGMSGQ